MPPRTQTSSRVGTGFAWCLQGKHRITRCSSESWPGWCSIAVIHRQRWKGLFAVTQTPPSALQRSSTASQPPQVSHTRAVALWPTRSGFLPRSLPLKASYRPLGSQQLVTTYCCKLHACSYRSCEFHACIISCRAYVRDSGNSATVVFTIHVFSIWPFCLCTKMKVNKCLFNEHAELRLQ